MRIYWNRSSIPEMAGLSKREQSLLWQRTFLHAFRHWQSWLAFGFLLLTNALASFVAVAVIPEDAAYSAFVYCAIIAGIPSGLAMVFVTYPVVVTMARPYMAKARGMGEISQP